MKATKSIKVILLMTCLSIALPTLAQKQEAEMGPAERFAFQNGMIGKKIPDLQFETLIQGPKSTLVTQKSLEGKVVILDFWTTWCAPCIKEFPRLNALSKAYEGRVVFISITPEDFKKANTVLSKRQLDTWVGTDTDRSVLKTFGIHAYPTTVVIDKQGKVVEYTHPVELTVAYIDYLLDDRIEEAKALNSEPKLGGAPVASFASMVDVSNDPNIQIVTTDSLKAAQQPVNEDKPNFAIRITEVAPQTFGAGMVSKKNGLIMMNGWTLREALAFAADLPEALISGPDSLLDKKMEVTAKLPKSNPELLNNLLMHSLQEEFDFKSVLVDEKVNLLELHAPNGANAKNLYPTEGAPGKISAADGIITARNWPLKGIIRNLEVNLSTTIVDKTNLDSHYDYQLYWNPKDPESIKKALQEQLGLNLIQNSEVKQTLKVIPNNSKTSNLLRGG